MFFVTLIVAVAVAFVVVVAAVVVAFVTDGHYKMHTAGPIEMSIPF